MQQSLAEIRQTKTGTYKKIVRWLWIGLILGMLGLLAFFLLLSMGDLPSFKELENPKSELATQIYGAEQEVFGRYYIENRVAVGYEDLSPHLVTAVVATEDERFHKHSGIDFRALGRVLIKTVLLRQENAGGASTLTQQLAKLLFTEKPGSGVERVMQKFKEWIIALRLERRYTKEEIIAMYLNKFEFINGAYGVQAAAEIYFGKDQKDLSVEEASTLVGMLKNPSLYNPRSRPEKTQMRRNVVMAQMKKNGLLTQDQFDLYKSRPLDMSNFKKQNQSDGVAAYFRAELGEELKRLFNRKEYRKPDGSKYNIYRDGLKVFTTIDPTMQKIAEKEMRKHMRGLQKNFWSHWKNKDPWTYREEETTDEEMDARESVLKRLVRGSERYKTLRTQFMDEICSKMTTDIKGLRLTDNDILRIQAQEKDPTYFDRQIKRKFFSKSRADKYRKAMKSDDYQILKKQWQKLELRVKNVFKIPVEMTVFAYNNKMETDTTMSPMDSIKYHRMFMQIGSMSVEPTTGDVKTWIGGINHKYFKYDHVRTRRQVGSTFKPFVYSTAIALQGFSPCFKVDDIPYTISPGEGNFYTNKEWTPANSSDKYSKESLTLRDALRKSVNSITVYLMKQIRSVNPVIGMVHNMGIDSTAKYPNGRYIVPRVPSIAIGATDLTVYEMAGAYNTFANNGTYIKPVFIKRIEDKNGRVIYNSVPEERQALNPRWNYVMLDMLKYVNSTANGFWEIKTENGGKTGTTNNHVDGWYMGVTPNLVMGTWVGGDERWIRFRSLRYGSGGKMARPFFKNFILALEKSEEVDWDKKARFKRPAGDLGVELDCSVYEELEKEEGAVDEDGDLMFDDLFGDEDLPMNKKDTSSFEIDF